LNFPSISTRPQQRSALNLPSIPPAFARYQSEIYGNRNIGQASGSSHRVTNNSHQIRPTSETTIGTLG
jgi:hypothetical protein